MGSAHKRCEPSSRIDHTSLSVLSSIRSPSTSEEVWRIQSDCRRAALTKRWLLLPVRQHVMGRVQNPSMASVGPANLDAAQAAGPEEPTLSKMCLFRKDCIMICYNSWFTSNILESWEDVMRCHYFYLPYRPVIQRGKLKSFYPGFAGKIIDNVGPNGIARSWCVYNYNFTRVLW